MCPVRATTVTNWLLAGPLGSGRIATVPMALPASLTQEAARCAFQIVGGAE
jgi:hypothetical protein